jgi:hypothetical protein
LVEGLKASGVTAFIDATLSCNTRPLVFAGAVRDAIFTVEHGLTSVTPRDFDVALVGSSREVFDGLLRDLGGQPNRYGGYRLPYSAAQPIDVWRLEETLGLRIHRAPCEVANVLRSFVLDINAIVFDPLSGYFHSRGAVEAIRKRRIGLVEGALIHSTATFAAKALLSGMRFSFSLSEPLNRFVRRYLDPGVTTYEATKAFGPRVDLGSSGGASGP